ncbi:MAG: AsmA family protein [Bacteroidetes bacterium]|nr:AsmA family protein [Bacteroidota bacterium]
MKIIKRILLGFFLFLVVVLAAAIVLPVVFRDQIEAAIKEEVSKNLLADVDWGKWSFSILRSFPNLSARVDDVRIINRAPFEGVELANIGSFSVTLDIKSLWSDQMEVLKVRLDEPNITVLVLDDGSANYNITKPSETETQTSPFHLALREYQISKGHIAYEDRKQGIRAELTNLEHTGSGDFTQDLFTLRTKTGVGTLDVAYGGIPYLRKANLELAAMIEVDVPNHTYRFSENELSINELVLGFEGWLSMPGKGYDMDITWRSKRSDLAMLLSLIPAEFASDLKGVDMSGSAAFNGQVKGIYQGETLPSISLLANVKDGRFRYPDLPQSAENIQLDLAVNYPGGSNLDKMIIDLKQLSLTMAGNPLSARMRLSNTISDPLIDAECKARLDLASISQVVPMEQALKGRLDADIRLKGALSAIENQRYEQFDADGELTLRDMTYQDESLGYPLAIRSLLFSFSPQFLSLDQFDGSLGSSAIKASGRMDNYLQYWLRDDNLRGQFTLSANKIDLNELAPSSEGSGEGEASEKAPAEGKEAQPSSGMAVITVPANVDFSLSATAAEVLYQNLSLSNVRGTMRINDQRLDLQELFFNLFGGSVLVSGGYNTKDAQAPRIDLTYAIRDLDIARTAEALNTVDKLAPIARYCQGKFSTNLGMKAVLDEHMEPVMSSITGRGTLNTSQVSISGFEPMTQLASALKIKELASTTLQNINLTYKIEDGKMITEPFDVKIGGMQAKVGGAMGVADQSLDYAMTSKIPTALFGAAAGQTVGGLLGLNQQALAGFAVPESLDATIAFTGTVLKPVVRPVFAGGAANLVESVVEEAKEQLNETIDNSKAEAIAKAKQERDRLIAEAQKQADKIKADARTEAARIKETAYKAADAELAKVKNPVAKAGAKLVADKAKAEADKKEAQAIAEADKRADGLVDTARKKGDDLVRKAEATNTTVK